MLSRKKRSSRNCSVVDHLAEVAVGGAEDADVDPERVVLADAADLARLEEPEQLDLHALVELADLVEEERAAVGDLEEPLAVGVGAGEGPLAVAEELALDEVLGQGPAVDRDEGAGRRGRLLSWRLRAISSLPVPVSPRIITLASVGAIVSIRRRTCCIDGRLADQRGRPLGGLEPGLQARRPCWPGRGARRPG